MPEPRSYPNDWPELIAEVGTHSGLLPEQRDSGQDPARLRMVVQRPQDRHGGETPQMIRLASLWPAGQLCGYAAENDRQPQLPELHPSRLPPPHPVQHHRPVGRGMASIPTTRRLWRRSSRASASTTQSVEQGVFVGIPAEDRLCHGAVSGFLLFPESRSAPAPPADNAVCGRRFVLPFYVQNAPDIPVFSPFIGCFPSFSITSPLSLDFPV